MLSLNLLRLYSTEATLTTAHSQMSISLYLLRPYYGALPDEHLLVVGGGDEPLGVLAEGDRVDGGEVLVVDLLDLARVGVVLHDVLVRAAREEDVLLRRVRVDLDAKGNLLVGEGGDALTRLRIP